MQVEAETKVKDLKRLKTKFKNMLQNAQRELQEQQVRTVRVWFCA